MLLKRSSSTIKGCTPKALIVGLLGALCIGLGSTYNDMIVKGSGLAVWNLTPAATFLFFVLVLLLNPLLRLLHPRLPLQRGELAVAFFLILLANTLSGRGLPAQLLPVITGAYYYATPENGWAEIVQPYMPDWPVPQSRDAIWGFYEGDPTGAVPWAIWAAPLLYWAVFGLALFLAMVCLMVIVRRQWVEHERLAYPMVQLPLAMIADDERGRTIKPLFRSGLMWVGFAVPFVLASINALHNYFVIIPTVSTSLGGLSMFRGAVSVGLNLNLSMVGFSYFIPQNIALGLVFFYIVNVVQRGLLGMLAWGGKDETMGAYSQYTDPIIIHQAMGGMIVLVLGSLWVGRRHLGNVLRKALGRAPEVEDADEITSYGVAVWGAVASFLGDGCLAVAIRHSAALCSPAAVRRICRVYDHCPRCRARWGRVHVSADQRTGLRRRQCRRHCVGHEGHGWHGPELCLERGHLDPNDERVCQWPEARHRNQPAPAPPPIRGHCCGNRPDADLRRLLNPLSRLSVRGH